MYSKKPVYSENTILFIYYQLVSIYTWHFSEEPLIRITEHCCRRRTFSYNLFVFFNYFLVIWRFPLIAVRQTNKQNWKINKTRNLN